MENSSHLLKNLQNDVNEVLRPSQSESIDENEADLIRRRRLERLAHSATSSPTTPLQDDDNNKNV